MNIKALFEQLIEKKNLTSEQITAVITACIEGVLNEAQIATFLALMRMKGESIEELSTAANVLLTKAHPIDLGQNLIDIVGTGGDGASTFNVSTVSSFVVAGAGARVAKHGNRSVSSKSGSADLLLTAGFSLNVPDETLKQSINDTGLAFLFGPHFHQALLAVRSARASLGIRTLFNLLGPLVNPAKVDYIVLGVYDTALQQPLAQVLASMGLKRAFVIHSQDGLDEVSIVKPTEVVEYHKGSFSTWLINPGDYGLNHTSLNDILINSPEESLLLAMDVFNQGVGPHRDMILLNSACALLCANKAPSIEEAITLAKHSIDSGHALDCFNRTRQIMQLTE